MELDVSIGHCSDADKVRVVQFLFAADVQGKFSCSSDSLLGTSYSSVSLLGTRFHGSFCTRFVFSASVQQRQSSNSSSSPFFFFSLLIS
jgi:hypothetical protein